MRKTTTVHWQSKINEAVLLILKTPTGTLDPRELSARLATSPWHFARCFHDLVGESPRECIRRLKLERAAYMLAHTVQDITSIALENGFSSGENLARAFRNSWGIKPRDVRTIPGWSHHLPSPAGIHYCPPGDPWAPQWFFHRKDTNMDVQIQKLPPWTLGGRLLVGDYWGLPKTWNVWGQNNQDLPFLKPQGRVMTVFMDHHDAVPMEDRRSFAAGELDKPLSQAHKDLGLVTLECPGGTYAITPHFGPSESIGQVWDTWRREWLPHSGWVLDTTRPSFEWYQNNPGEGLGNLQVTLLCDPVKPRA